MRSFRPLYENFVHADDVIQKRATRSTTESVRKHMAEDAYEGYLTAMSRNGTYGGQPELLAFVRAYDQDVMVHIPPSAGWDTDTIPYHNEHRDANVEAQAPLHICYGGDEEKNAHYDSSQKSMSESQGHNAVTSKLSFRQNIHATQQNHAMSPRALRNVKADPHKDMMHEMVTRGGKDLRSGLDFLNEQRARSPSVTSSHYSTSSKRSFEDDGETLRQTKRADRKKRSLRSRAAARQLSGSPGLTIPQLLHDAQPTSSGPPTPTSSQDTDSSDQAESSQAPRQDSAAPSPPKIEVIDLADDDDTDYRNESIQAKRSIQTSAINMANSSQRRSPMSIASLVNEVQRPPLQI